MLKHALYNLSNFVKVHSPLPRNDLVIVYTMRKVASTTITNTLRNKGFVVYKQHCLNSINNNRFTDALMKAKEPVQHWLFDGKRFYKRLQLWKIYRNAHRCKIIVLVRDPLILNLSDIFTQLTVEFPLEFKRLMLDVDTNLTTFAFNTLNKQLKNTLLDEYFYYLTDFPKHWFHSELKSIFGIDVFQTEFPKDQGYQIYQGAYVDVLLIRSEDVNKIASKALNEFLGLDLVGLDNRNVTEKEGYASLYQQMKSNFKLSSEFLDTYYAQSYVNHFYTEAEVENFKSNWL